MRLLPTTSLTPFDWRVEVRFRDQARQVRRKIIGVAPLSRTEQAWHETTEALAVKQAIHSIIWGKVPHFRLPVMVSIRLDERPGDIIDVKVRRRHHENGRDDASRRYPHLAGVPK